METAVCLFRASLSGQCWIHGPGQLGCRPGGRSQVRLQAAVGAAALQFDGDSVTDALSTARDSHPARSGASLPRDVSTGGVVDALGVVRDRHCRLRFGRGFGGCDCPESALSSAFARRSAAHRPGHPTDPVVHPAGNPGHGKHGFSAGAGDCQLFFRGNLVGKAGSGRDLPRHASHPGRS